MTIVMSMILKHHNSALDYHCVPWSSVIMSPALGLIYDIKMTLLNHKQTNLRMDKYF